MKKKIIMPLHMKGGPSFNRISNVCLLLLDKCHFLLKHTILGLGTPSQLLAAVGLTLRYHWRIVQLLWPTVAYSVYVHELLPFRNIQMQLLNSSGKSIYILYVSKVSQCRNNPLQVKCIVRKIYFNYQKYSQQNGKSASKLLNFRTKFITFHCRF